MKKRLFAGCFLTGLLFLLILASSCKKQKSIPLCCAYPSLPIRFEVVDKNGNGVVQSVNDILTITYVNSGGSTITNRLDIFKVQKSQTDTTRVAKYNGYVLSDADPNMPDQGYLVTPGSGNIHDFKFYLNNQLLGSVNYSYQGAATISTTSPVNSFTFNSTPASVDIINGILAAGFPSSVGYAENQYFTIVADIPVYVLHLQ